MNNKLKFSLRVCGVVLLLIYIALILITSDSLLNSIVLGASVCCFLVILLYDFLIFMFKRYFSRS